MGTREPCIIVSTDKDMDQIPGLHYDWIKNVTYEVTPEDARRNFWVQVLAGDATDNIQGIPGTGVKTAEKLLENCDTDEEAWAIVKHQYEEAYGTYAGESTALEMARLVHILTKPLVGDNYWTPPE